MPNTNVEVTVLRGIFTIVMMVLLKLLYWEFWKSKVFSAQNQIKIPLVPIKSLLLCLKVTWLPVFGVAYIRGVTMISRRHRNVETNPKSAFASKWHTIPSGALNLFSKSPKHFQTVLVRDPLYHCCRNYQMKNSLNLKSEKCITFEIWF